jgi:hypothetical protein
MAADHTIRLHAAWKRIDHAADSNDELGTGSVKTVSLPDLSLNDVSVKQVTFQRRFNRPTGLSDSDKVAIHCGLLTAAAEIAFNDVAISVPTQPMLDISRLLMPHNELRVLIAAEQFQVASRASAALEITRAD